MSLLVSFNGQFSPYQLPNDLSHNRVNEASSTSLIHDEYLENFLSKEEFSIVKKNRDKRKDTSNSAVESYLKVKDQVIQKRDVKYAKDLMSLNVHTLDESDRIQNAIVEMSKFRFHHLPVLREDVLVGILSEKDLMQYLYSKSKDQEVVENIMTKNVLTALETTEVRDVARVMYYERIKCLPILNAQKALVGIITHSDLLKYLMNSSPLETII